MSMDWQVWLWQSGDTYTQEDNIQRPNENLETQLISTQQKIKLADGSNAFVTFETKYTKEPFTMTFFNTTSDFRTQISSYITSGDKIKIITHTSEEFIGRFLDMRRVWFTGLEDTYDIQVSFEQME